MRSKRQLPSPTWSPPSSALESNSSLPDGASHWHQAGPKRPRGSFGLVRTDAKPNSTDRVDQGYALPAVDFAAQIADIHVQHIVVAFKIVLPDMFQYCSARRDAAGVAHQVFEKRVF